MDSTALFPIFIPDKTRSNDSLGPVGTGTKLHLSVPFLFHEFSVMCPLICFLIVSSNNYLKQKS